VTSQRNLLSGGGPAGTPTYPTRPGVPRGPNAWGGHPCTSMVATPGPRGGPEDSRMPPGPRGGPERTPGCITAGPRGGPGDT